MMKMLLRSDTFLLSMLVLHLVRSDHPNCQPFDDLAQKFTEEHQSGSLTLSCNSTRSQITCSGLLHSQTGICFGLRLNHCDQPVTVDLYVALPDQNISLEKTVAPRSGTQEIPGDLNRSDKREQIVLEAAMMQVNCSYIYLRIGSHVKVEDISENITISPNTYLNLPPCDDYCAQKTPFKAPSVCRYPNPSSSTPKSQGHTTAKLMTVSGGSKTYNTSCSPGQDLCSKYEVCSSKALVCVCSETSSFNPQKGVCQPDKSSYHTSCEFGIDACSPHEKCSKTAGVCVCDDDAKFDPKKGVCQPKNISGSKTYNTSCYYGLDICALHEMCSMAGVCVCEQKSSFNPQRGVCQPDKITREKSATEETPPAHQACPAKPVDCPKPVASETQKEAIVGTVVGIVALFVIVRAAIFCMYIKYRRKQHTLLSDWDDDQEMGDQVYT